MKKSSMFFGLIIAIAIFFTACNSKSGHLDEKPTSAPIYLGGELLHPKIIGLDTLYTGKILNWSYDSKTGEVKAFFDGNGDRLGIIVKGKMDDVHGLLSTATDSVGIKHVWDGDGMGSVWDYWIIQEFYSGPKYDEGQTVYFNPDMLDISFDANGRITNATVASFVGDYKFASIDSKIAPEIINKMISSTSSPLIGAKYKNDGWEFMSITTPE